jgi:hypothetical protein
MPHKLNASKPLWAKLLKQCRLTMPLVSLTFIQTRQDRGKVGNQPFADFGVSGQIKVVAILGVNALQLISDSLRASVQSLRQNFRLTAVLNQCF